MLSDTTPAPTWGQENFGEARLRDKRRTRSLVDLADRILQHPGGSLPDKFNGDPNALERCYNLMNSPHVTHAAVLEPHCQHTGELLRQHQGVALLSGDQTERDFTGKHSLHDQLGQIGNGAYRGYICHSVLAVNPLERSAFGLVNQILHIREDVPPGETRTQKRVRATRASRLWLTGVQGLEAAPEGGTRSGGESANNRTTACV